MKVKITNNRKTSVSLKTLTAGYYEVIPAKSSKEVNRDMIHKTSWFAINAAPDIDIEELGTPSDKTPLVNPAPKMLRRKSEPEKEKKKTQSKKSRSKKTTPKKPKRDEGSGVKIDDAKKDSDSESVAFDSVDTVTL